MKTKYTVIYTKRWQSGSHWHALTKMKRVEIECNDTNRAAKLAEAVDTEDIQYIFKDWPPMLGEEVGDVFDQIFE